MTVVGDSDILIDVSRGRDAIILAKWKALFGALVCAPSDEWIGRRTGEYLRRYGKSHSLELGDALIAAGTVANGGHLWTRNRKHYPMPELTFFD